MLPVDIDDRAVPRRRLDKVSQLSHGGFHRPLTLPMLDVPYVVGDNSDDKDAWKYEYRRQAQEICTGVWLGQFAQLKNGAFLKTNGILLVVSLAPAIINRLLDKYDLSTICVLCLDNETLSGWNNVIPFLRDMCLKMDMVLDAGMASTFIVCETGNTNGALGAAAYLIHKYQMTMERAVQHVQQRRLSVALGAPALYILKTFEMLCTATTQTSLQCRTSNAIKRARENQP
jgi:hypothetical protein